MWRAPFRIAVRIPRDRPRDEIVPRLAVGERVDVGENQPLDGVGDRRVVVDRMERLLLVRHPHQVALVARGRDRLVRRQRDARGVRRRDVRILPERRERRRDDLLRDALVGDAGDVVDPHAAGALGHEQVLAAQLQAARRALRAVRRDRRKPPISCLMPRVPVGVGVAVQVAADHRLRLLPFGDLHGLTRRSSPTHALKPTKLTKFVPCSRSCAMIALLSFGCET